MSRSSACFFWFAERHNHGWLQKLDRSKIDLGKGKRMLVQGGKLHTEYKITVPKNLMAASEQYRQRAAPLIRAIPLVATETCFALKGGTAINLFVRDMPRLSVDIDLT